jgi:hypothetical protein
MLVMKKWMLSSLTLLIVPMLGIASPSKLQLSENYVIITAPTIMQRQNQDTTNTTPIKSNYTVPNAQLVVDSLEVANHTHFDEDYMTRIQISAKQDLPNNRLLSIQSTRDTLHAKKGAEEAKLNILFLLQTLREEWVKLYYWEQVIRLDNEENTQLQQLKTQVMSKHGNPEQRSRTLRDIQLDIKQSGREIHHANRRLEQLEETLHPYLWEHEDLSHVQSPTWPKPAVFSTLAEQLKSHPMITKDQADNFIRLKNIQYLKEERRPTYAFGLDFGFRQASEEVYVDQSEFLGMQINMATPTESSNDYAEKILAAEIQYAELQKQELEDYHTLNTTLQTSYNRFRECEKNYRASEIELAILSDQLKNAKQSPHQKQSDLSQLLRTYEQYYYEQRCLEKAKLDRMMARASLLYLAGE